MQKALKKNPARTWVQERETRRVKDPSIQNKINGNVDGRRRGHRVAFLELR